MNSVDTLRSALRSAAEDPSVTGSTAALPPIGELMRGGRRLRRRRQLRIGAISGACLAATATVVVLVLPGSSPPVERRFGQGLGQPAQQPGVSIDPRLPRPSVTTWVSGPSPERVPATGEVDRPVTGMPVPVPPAGTCPSGRTPVMQSVIRSTVSDAHGAVSPVEAVRRLGYTGELQVEGVRLVELRGGHEVATFRAIALPDGSWFIDKIDVSGGCG